MSDRPGSSQHKQSPDDRMRELAALIADGRHDPIDILPCGQILNGHQRLVLSKAWSLSNVTIRVKHE